MPLTVTFLGCLVVYIYVHHSIVHVFISVGLHYLATQLMPTHNLNAFVALYKISLWWFQIHMWIISHVNLEPHMSHVIFMSHMRTSHVMVPNSHASNTVISHVRTSHVIVLKFTCESFCNITCELPMSKKALSCVEISEQQLTAKYSY